MSPFGWALAALLAARAFAAPELLSVPLRFQRLTPGLSGVVFDLDFGEGGSKVTLPLRFDTGSNGIDVLRRMLPEGAYRPLGKRFKRSYGGGMHIEGEEAMTVVGIGGVSVPIRVQLIDSVSCTAKKPNCYGKDGGKVFDTYRWYGIAGVGVRSGKGGVYSPLAQLPGNLGRGHIVSLHDMKLYLGLDQAARSLFGPWIRLKAKKKYPDGRTAWDDDGLKLCFSIEGTPVQNACARGMLDSGYATMVVEPDSLPSETRRGNTLRHGYRVSAWVPGAFRWNFKTRKGAELIQSDPGAPEIVHILGAPFFMDWDVLYDIDNGLIGLRWVGPLARARSSR